MEDSPDKDARAKAFADKLTELRASEKAESSETKVAKTPAEVTKEEQAKKFAGKLSTYRGADQVGLLNLESIAEKIGEVDPKTKKFIDKHTCSKKFQKKQIQAVKTTIKEHKEKKKDENCLCNEEKT